MISSLAEAGRLTETIGRALGYENVREIERIEPAFGASWALASPATVAFGCAGLFALAMLYYLKSPTKLRTPTRLALGTLRGITLAVLLLILADPVLRLTFVSEPKPLLWVLFDGSDSMNLRDDYTAEQREALDEAFVADTESDTPSRLEYARAWAGADDAGGLQDLESAYRVKYFVIDSPDQSREVVIGEEAGGGEDQRTLSESLSATGTVTPLGTALEDLARRQSTGKLSGVLMVSDFGHNTGSAPDGVASRLGVPVSTLGIGAVSARDLAVELETPVKMKKDEQSSVEVRLSQQDLDGETVTVEVYASEADGAAGQGGEKIGSREVVLDGPRLSLEFPWEPKSAGRYVFRAVAGQPTGADAVAKLAGELVEENNADEREVTVIDDFMRLLFIEYEPTWEWRFVKEVFHRDKLVGMRGFRTFLRSADPSVKENNELFLESLTRSRNEFFKNDVIFLGDMPAATLNSRFSDMLEEFVGRFGGGLVVMAGPRFGPKELARTPIADMLPVVVDPDAQLRDTRPFAMQPTLAAESYPFMRLGTTDRDNAEAWQNLSEMPWYQPVRRLEPSASTLLAGHPTDLCADGKTPQPLIAVRKYGRGEVVYIATNEMWRLRRKFGEKYYRAFWGQLIYRLGLSHALGEQKRFVVRTDRDQYVSDDEVTITVDAYTEDFEPLTSEEIGGPLTAELLPPSPDGNAEPQTLILSELRPGTFQWKQTVQTGGEYRLTVRDPVAGEDSDPVFFHVREETIERRDPVRNVAVQEAIAKASGGRSYDLTTVNTFLDDFPPPSLKERQIEVSPLWDTWLVFGLVVLLLLTEWATRKARHLA